MALKVTDDMRVYSTDEETCLRQSAGNWLIVVTGAFHNDACFSIKILDQPSKRSKVRRKVRHIKRLLNYLSAGTEDCNCTLPFGNIYTYCVSNAGNGKNAKAIDSTIYLMKNVQCPAILVECGFLSNRTETGQLLTGGYQLKLAVCIAAGFLQHDTEGASA